MANSSDIPKILVVGEAGVGKSTLIALLKNDEESTPEVGDAMAGVTKDVMAYQGRLGDREVIFLDTPGIGDCEVSVVKIVETLNMLSDPNREAHQRVNAVLLLSRVGGRFGLSAQVYSKIMKLAVGPDGVDQIFLVGTQANTAAGNVDKFLKDYVTVFEKKSGFLVPGKNACAVGCTRDSLKPLIQAVLPMLDRDMPWTTPDAQLQADALAEVLATDPAVMYKEILAEREAASRTGAFAAKLAGKFLAKQLISKGAMAGIPLCTPSAVAGSVGEGAGRLLGEAMFESEAEKRACQEIGGWGSAIGTGAIIGACFGGPAGSALGAGLGFSVHAIGWISGEVVGLVM